MRENDNHYFIDTENPTEMARLIHQGSLITQGLDGPLDGLTEQECQQLHAILDIACGPGEWVLRVAEASNAITTTTTVTGVDISRQMIDYARAQAKMRDFPHARFEVMDILHPFTFADHSFDLVNARTLMAVIPSQSWATVLQECRRVTRPGGIIRLTECEMPLSASPNHMRLNDLISQATHAAGHGFSPNGNHIVITPMLIPMLKQVGCQQIHSKGYGISITSGSELYETILQQAVVSYQLLRPFVVGKGLLSEEDFDALTVLALADMQAPDFSAIWYFFSAWGMVPEQ
jgi:ubiquinone/menaquinone biosynthesis C-methylase UbiE